MLNRLVFHLTDQYRVYKFTKKSAKERKSSHLRTWMTWSKCRCNNRTYEKTDADEVWTASDQPAFENRHWTVQLTIFADGSALPPLLIFRDKG